MYLCSVENLSSFQSKLDFKKILKLLKNRAKHPLVQGLRPNFIKNH